MKRIVRFLEIARYRLRRAAPSQRVERRTVQIKALSMAAQVYGETA